MNINKKIAISESGFIFDSSSGDSYTLNPIALKIIGFIRDGYGLEEIKKALIDEYDVSDATLDKTLDEFMINLKDFKIISDK